MLILKNQTETPSLTEQVENNRLYYTVKQLSECWSLSVDDILQLGETDQLSFMALVDWEYPRAGIIERREHTPVDYKEVCKIYGAKEPYTVTGTAGETKDRIVKGDEVILTYYPGIDNLIIQATEVKKFETHTKKSAWQSAKDELFNKQNPLKTLAVSSLPLAIQQEIERHNRLDYITNPFKELGSTPLQQAIEDITRTNELLELANPLLAASEALKIINNEVDCDDDFLSQPPPPFAHYQQPKHEKKVTQHISQFLQLNTPKTKEEEEAAKRLIAEFLSKQNENRKTTNDAKEQPKPTPPPAPKTVSPNTLKDRPSCGTKGNHEVINNAFYSITKPYDEIKPKDIVNAVRQDHTLPEEARIIDEHGIITKIEKGIMYWKPQNLYASEKPIRSARLTELLKILKDKNNDINTA